MADAVRILIGTSLPPLTLPSRRPRQIRPDGLVARLGRLICILAALALPAFGIAVADTIHRAGQSWATSPVSIGRPARAIAAGAADILRGGARP